ncbi:MAG: hypothetical protein D3904_07980, partial [Candidatus Electrothrix sp. EH2]|nr:hypothetical protein [Candidatus Electrothrix sp. EH2]
GTLYNDEVLLVHKDCIHALSNPGASRAEALEQALYLAGRLAELKDGLDQVLDLFALHCKEKMITLLNGEQQADPALAPKMREGWNVQRLSAMVDAVEAARYQLARNCNRALVCEVLLLEFFS